MISEAFILTGAILSGLGIYQFFRQRSRITRAVKTEGIVVELLQQRKEGRYIRTKTGEGVKLVKKYMYRPVIEFTAQSGHTVRFNASVASGPAPYQVGDKVVVIYEPENPRQAQVYSPLYLWFHTLMLVGFGIFFAAMGLLGLLLA